MVAMSFRSPASLLVLLLVACNKPDDAPLPNRSQSSSTPAPSASPPDAGRKVVPFVDDAQKPGPAYLSTSAGLVVVDGGKLTTVTKFGSDDLDLAPDGAVWSGVGIASRIEGDQVTQPEKVFGNDVALAADGTAWVAGYTEIKSISSSGKVSAVASPTSVPPKHVGVDAKGTLFVSGIDTMHRRTANGWELVDTKVLGAKPFVIGFVSRPGGALYVHTADAVAKVGEDGTLTKVELPAKNPAVSNALQAGSLSVAGVLAFRLADAALIVDPNGKSERIAVKSLGVAASRVTGVAVDGQGRRWIGTDGGLFIFSATGEPLQKWLPGALPGNVKTLVLVGAGPELPSAAPAPQKGSIKGKLVVGGKPVPNAELELCDNPAFYMSAATPCASSPLRFSTKTDADGAFAFPEVVRQPYGVAFKSGGKWKMADRFPCCSGIKPDVETDLGLVTFDTLK